MNGILWMRLKTALKKRTAVAILCLVLFTGSVFGQNNLEKGYKFINREDLQSCIKYLSSEELEGRYAGTQGYNKAAEFIKSELEKIGVLPAASNQYYQEFNIYEIGPDPIKEFSIVIRKDTLKFIYREDFYAGTGWSRKAGKVNLNSNIVFVGYGITAPELNYDDYSSFDVKGKVVMIISGVPDIEGKDFSEYEQSRKKIINALNRGVKGIIYIPQQEMKPEKWREVLEKMEKSSGMVYSSTDKDITADDFRFFYGLRYSSSNLLFEKLFGEPLEKFERDFSASETKVLDSCRLLIEGEFISEPNKTKNVIGKVEGSSPDLKDDYVIVGAHLDHIGRRNGLVCPGANDNASGCAALLEIGQALVNGNRPKRSVILIFFSAEEIGGLGARYYTENPTVPLKNIKAMINLDCLAISGAPDYDKNTIYLVGSEKLSKELKSICKSVNERTENFTISNYYDESGEKPKFDKSDQYHFHLKEIPTLFFYTGEYLGYHMPGDKESRIEYNKLERITRLIYATVLEICNNN